MAARWARSSRSVVQAAGLLAGASRSFSGDVRSRAAVALQRVEHVALGGLDALGLDDRGDDGLAAQRLLGVGLGLVEDLLLGLPEICR